MREPPAPIERTDAGDFVVRLSPEERDLLRRLHGSTHHVGERYAERAAATPEPVQEAARLREQLRVAVESENFELAAELRDRLRVLE